GDWWATSDRVEPRLMREKRDKREKPMQPLIPTPLSRLSRFSRERHKRNDPMNRSIECGTQPMRQETPVLKRCIFCQEPKPDAEFFSSHYTADGLTDRCRLCVFAAARRDRTDREHRRRGLLTRAAGPRRGIDQSRMVIEGK